MTTRADTEDSQPPGISDTSLYWKVCLINGAVLAVGVLVLVLSPVRVSPRVVVSEVVVVVGGLAVMLVANALLLRAALAPVDRVIKAMATAELAGPSVRVDDGVGDGVGRGDRRGGAGARLVASYHAMLDRLEQERASSNAKALAAQEAERQRIAHELHDQVGQSLTVVLLGLKQLAARVPAELRDELDLVRESARAGLDDVRRVARELRPGVLEDLGLPAALSALVTDVTGAGGPTVRRTTSPGLPELGHDVELVVYRVAQEALTNVVRHAVATRVELSLLRVGDAVALEVVDDGRGFAVEDTHPDAAGLQGMADRASLVGGTLEVASAEGRGTMVRLWIPLVGSDAGEVER